MTDAQAPKSSTGEPRILIGRYRLDHLINEREFAQLFRGYDLDLQRVVAIKLIKRGRLDSADEFVVQVRQVARLKHPGIVPIYDVEQEDGTCFIASEFVEGGNLSAFTGRQLLSTPQVIRWMIDITEALEYAHENGVVHGDVKPENILIDVHGRSLVADFGIARFASKTGTLLPSVDALRSMSPEQLEGKTPDARSDIYCLGIVFHQLLTGQLPYLSSDSNALRQKILSGATISLKSIPRGLRRICTRALKRDPNDRYTSASQLIDDLRNCSVWSSTRRVLVGALGAVVFVVGFGLTGWWPNQNPKSSVTNSETAWMTHVATLAAKEQVEAVAVRLVELNHGFSGDMKETIQDGVVIGLEFLTDDITDISPVQALVGLTSLSCSGTYTTKSNGRLADLLPLKRMKLTTLSCDFNEQISNLTPLDGMSLTNFNCSRTSVADLSPLKEMPLKVLVCGFTHISDLSPLKGINLTELYCDHTSVTDLTPLEGMPLEQVSCQNTLVSSLVPLHGAPLRRLECNQTPVADLTPLKGMSELSVLNLLSTKIEDLSPLEDLPNLNLLWCDFVQTRDAEILRSLKSLKFINNNPVATFWEELDKVQ